MYDNYTMADFYKDQRIELHPATDLWMAGARYGTVVKVGRTRVHVQLDRAKGVKKIALGLLRPVLDGHYGI
jgi:hypothetical protein